MSIRVVTYLSYKQFVESWAESFLFAGSSALLLLIANILSEYWYFYFFALTPFLYKISRASPSEGLRLGFLFGISFFTVSLFHIFTLSLFLPIVKIICGTILFSLFGWLTAWTRKRWGFNPIMIALIWVIVNISIAKFGFTRDIINTQGLSEASSILNGIATVFGLVFISFIIVSINSLIVFVLFKVFTSEIIGIKLTETCLKLFKRDIIPILYIHSNYLIPEDRSPPILSVSLF